MNLSAAKQFTAKHPARAGEARPIRSFREGERVAGVGDVAHVSAPLEAKRVLPPLHPVVNR